MELDRAQHVIFVIKNEEQLKTLTSSSFVYHFVSVCTQIKLNTGNRVQRSRIYDDDNEKKTNRNKRE